MSFYEGLVTVNSLQGIELYGLDEDGSARIKCAGFNVNLSPEGLHRFLQFLNGREYPRAVVISRKKWQALTSAIGNMLINIYNSGSHEHPDTRETLPDIREVERALESLENELF